jgi:hypothetical protein
MLDPIGNTLVFSTGKTWIRNMQARPLHVIEWLATTALVRFNTPVRIW